jgi:hypothetical protein
LTKEHKENNILRLFQGYGEEAMVRAVVEEALALASLSLFLATVAVWALLLGVI